MIYLQLFWEFFKIGLFAIGGGMATLPFLQQLADSSGWYSQSLITDMIAISESTPGPIGINMATYVGYNVAGISGGIIATLGEIVPALIIVCLVSTGLERFRQSKLVDSAFYGLRPAVTGLICAALISVIKVSMLRIELYSKSGLFQDLLDFRKLIFFAAIFFAIRWFKKHPIVYIAISAFIGIVLCF